MNKADGRQANRGLCELRLGKGNSLARILANPRFTRLSQRRFGICLRRKPDRGKNLAQNFLICPERRRTPRCGAPVDRFWTVLMSLLNIEPKGSEEKAQNVVDSRNSSLDSFRNHRYQPTEVACKDLRRAWPCCQLQTDRSHLMRATIRGRGAVLGIMGLAGFV